MQDLWQRLARLDTCCEVMIRSVRAENGRLRWRLTIRRRDAVASPLPAAANPDHAEIVIDADTAREAITRGVEEAARRNWIAP